MNHLNLTHTESKRECFTSRAKAMYVAVCSRPAGRPFGILIQPVQEKFPRPIKMERTSISADTRETTRRKMAQVHGLDS